MNQFPQSTERGLSIGRLHLDRSNWITNLSKFNNSNISEVHSEVEQAIDQLVQLLKDAKFTERYLTIACRPESKEVAKFKINEDKAIFRLMTSYLRSIGGDRANLKHLANQAVSNEEQRDILVRKLREENQDHYSHYDEALERLKAAREIAAEHLCELLAQIEQHRQESNLCEAFEIWGRSRNLYNHNNSGDGYHAGVVHYFEYRSDLKKSNRFAKPPTISEFVELSLSFKKLIRPSRLDELNRVKAGLLIEDERGQQRAVIYTTDNIKVIAFRKSAQPMRLLSYYPSKPEWLLKDNLIAEIKCMSQVDGDKRFNRLGNRRQLVASIGVDLNDTISIL